MKSVFHRIYGDYLMSSRLGEYERIIATALGKGYQHLTIPEFYNLLKNNAADPHAKYFIHRHDIDTDPRTARRFFEVEVKQGIKTSYYFRLSTLDFGLMREIHAYGSEVGYHYEELSQYGKDHRIKTKAGMEKHYGEIRKIFIHNFNMVQDRAGFKIRTIASHGDFVNRKLGISNFAFVDRALMDRLDIDFECYDPLLLENYGDILSDFHYPKYYRPHSPFESMEKGAKRVYLLTHPRHWRTARWINTKDNLQRFIEGIKYKK